MVTNESEIGALPLRGVRVLDFTRVLSGPFATMILGDLGAEVIKIEERTVGDETREIPPMSHGESHYFLSTNRNKQSLALDLRDPRGRAIALDLVRCSDIMIENFRPGVAARLHLGYEAVHQINPKLVYCSISAFGQSGPLSNRSAFDIVIQALSGAMSLTGEPGSSPMRSGAPISDFSAGLFAVIGALAALFDVRQSGQGRYVDISLLDSTLGLLGYQASRYLMTNHVPQRMGNQHLGIVPYGTFRAKDGFIVIAVLTESFWPKLCEAIGRPNLSDDKRYNSNRKRLETRDEVNRVIEDALSEKTVDEWCTIFNDVDVPNAPVLALDDALGQEQVVARKMIQTLSHPVLGPVNVIGPVIKFSDASDHSAVAPPRLGGDSRDVLARVLHYNEDTISALIASDVVCQVTEDSDTNY